MKFRLGAACAALAIAAVSPSAAAAQSTDAFVLPPGMFRLSVQGTHESFDSRFDASGNRTPLAQGLLGDLTPARFAALRPLSTQLGDFFVATNGGAGASPDPVDASAISLGTLDVRAAASRTHAPAQLSVGLFPRVEIGASIPINRGDRFVQRLGLAGGNVGINPNATLNGEILSRIGWGPLGASELLPTAQSPAGIELQSRATALAGEALTLPEAAADSTMFQSLLAQHYGLAPLASRTDPVRVGDAEVYARVLLLSTFGQAPVPVDPAGLHMRVAIFGGARLPTGTEPDSFPLLSPRPTERLSSYHAGGAADFFLGSRFWATGSARLTWNTSTEVTRRVAPADSPLSVVAPPQAVTIAPGNALQIGFAPRYRLLESIAIGANYSAIMVGDTRYSGGEESNAEVLDLAGGGLHRLGLEIRYSSLPAYWAGRASLPAEVIIAYQKNIAGPEGSPAGGMLSITASILPQFWGRPDNR